MEARIWPEVQDLSEINNSDSPGHSHDDVQYQRALLWWASHQKTPPLPRASLCKPLTVAQQNITSARAPFFIFTSSFHQTFPISLSVLVVHCHKLWNSLGNHTMSSDHLHTELSSFWSHSTRLNVPVSFNNLLESWHSRSCLHPRGMSPLSYSDYWEGQCWEDNNTSENLQHNWGAWDLWSIWGKGKWHQDKGDNYVQYLMVCD